ncbi:transporter substrate-binding domain-containing protein [Ruminococcus sp. CLA-AA-H200]|uniref:Transporter substrate-binding domain-containing protein n=1 Tax=Ruminococcus turbiniformis TaxID=2881258 RepID=A0ABS8G312_9FIRM|nr:transporter substrate-binding domain-containing protein [Ruminococcus turbiniformis]MCC2255787.1 transporter substrate-binding domain-containing protein [Ruminococcus turbiniformis]
MKKRVLALLLAACTAMSFAACSSGEDSSGSSDSGSAESTDSGSGDSDASTEIETVTPGVLTVATSPDFAPYEFYAIDEEGNPTLAGFDIALAQYIADYMGLELQIVTVDFDGVLSELQTKSVDLGMSGFAPDPDREAIMEFSDSYYTGSQSVVTTKDNADTYNSFEALNNPDVTIGAQTGSIQLDLANENSADADIISLPKVTDIISELLAGTMDAAYIETDVAKSYQQNYPDLEIVLEVPYEQNGASVGVVKDNPELLAAVNEAIAQALSDGSMETFIAEANEQASGQTYEGLLDENGNVQ